MDQTEVSRGEVLRYMGCKGAQSEAVMALVEDCLAQLGQACEPRHLTAVFPLSLSADGGIDGGCFRTHSRNLSRNLADCHKIIVFAATLGTGADHLIHKYSRLEMSRAVVLQAAAAAMIEEYCDQVCSALKEEYEARGEYLRPRFSPGYGDFPLECQPALLNALEAGKRIGIKLTMTDSFMLAPSKSVTAVMGISKKPHRCDVRGCEACGKTDCAYRR